MVPRQAASGPSSRWVGGDYTFSGTVVRKLNVGSLFITLIGNWFYDLQPENGRRRWKECQSPKSIPRSRMPLRESRAICTNIIHGEILMLVVIVSNISND